MCQSRFCTTIFLKSEFDVVKILLKFDIFDVSIVGHIFDFFSLYGLPSLALSAEVHSSATKVSLFC